MKIGVLIHFSLFSRQEVITRSTFGCWKDNMAKNLILSRHFLDNPLRDLIIFLPDPGGLLQMEANDCTLTLPGWTFRKVRSGSSAQIRIQVDLDAIFCKLGKFGCRLSRLIFNLFIRLCQTLADFRLKIIFYAVYMQKLLNLVK